ncbi:MAG TPA: response regulator [Chloroflexia bacterium]|nr:response regulator [Chloroflexia bacterium]
MPSEHVQTGPLANNTPGENSHLKLLVVDDDPDALNITSYCLERAGYYVIKARSGSEALDKARQERPSLAILDRMLPEMDGLEICDHLRKEDPNIFVVMLSALGSTNERINGWEAGADDYITKPFSPKELVLRIQAVLRRTRSVNNSANNIAPLTQEQSEPVPESTSISETNPSSPVSREEFKPVDYPPQSLESLLVEAHQASVAGYMALARESYLKVLDRDPNNSVALKWLAYRTVDPYEGCKYLERLIEVQPDNAKARRLLDIGRRRCQELDQLTYSNILSMLKTGGIAESEHSKKPQRLPLGEMLVDRGFISRDHIETAASLQEMFRKAGSPRKLGEILVEYGYLSEDQLQRVLNEQQQLPE